jgi:hypothetical protein
MGKTPRILVILTSIVSTPTHPAAAENLAIVINTFEHTKMPADVLESAKEEATRIYAALRIELVWTTESSGRDIHLAIRVTDAAVKGASRSAMGIALRNGNGRSMVLVFLSRVETFARYHNKPVAQILGYVVAHEMGHLLLPDRSHSMSGIMTAGWNGAQVEEIGNGSLSFSPEQGERIRTKLRKFH